MDTCTDMFTDLGIGLLLFGFLFALLTSILIVRRQRRHAAHRASMSRQDAAIRQQIMNSISRHGDSELP